MAESDGKTDRPEGTSASDSGYDTLRVCVNFRAGDILPSCAARGSKDLAAALERKLPDALPSMKLMKVHCLGRCHLGPTLRLSPIGPFLLGVGADDVDWLLAKLAAGEIDALREAFPDPKEEEQED